MKPEKEIREEVEKITKDFWHILDQYPQTFDINAYVSAMQLTICARLDGLYFALGEKRPRYKCDDMTKKNH